jgi:hypothetical protein
VVQVCGYRSEGIGIYKAADEGREEERERGGEERRREEEAGR